MKAEVDSVLVSIESSLVYKRYTISKDLLKNVTSKSLKGF